MIKINFQVPDNDEWRAWVNKCNDKQKKCIDNFYEKDVIEIDDKLYKEQKNQVFINKNSPFYGKCAYCEVNIYSNQYGDIEHFRPKAKLTDENNQLIKVIRDSIEIVHSGYYWLVYDWKNLLPSCELCNRPSKTRSDEKLIGKRNQFPVKDFRALEPGEEVMEEPLLINPVHEDPEKFIAADKTGILSSIDGNERGLACIKILGLNDRDLPNLRKKKYDDVFLKMQLLAQTMAKDANSEESKDLLNSILEIKKGFGEFTLIARQAMKDSLINLYSLFRLLAV